MDRPIAKWGIGRQGPHKFQSVVLFPLRKFVASIISAIPWKLYMMKRIFGSIKDKSLFLGLFVFISLFHFDPSKN